MLRQFMESKHHCLICNIVGAVIAVGIAGPVTLWALDRTPAYTITPAEVRPDPARPGEPLDLLRIITVHRQGCTAVFNREIKDSTTYVWTYPITESTFVGLPLGVHRTHSVHPFRLAVGAADGDATVTTNIWSVCNPVQRLFPVHYRSATEHFTIKRDPEDRKGPADEDAK